MRLHRGGFRVAFVVLGDKLFCFVHVLRFGSLRRSRLLANRPHSKKFFATSRRICFFANFNCRDRNRRYSSANFKRQKVCCHSSFHWFYCYINHRVLRGKIARVSEKLI